MEILRKKLSLLPNSPGVYLMKNEAGNIIYVGKAKILRNRVRSYFTGCHDQKTQKLVNEIADFEYILTASEVEALLLECSLIKKHNPHYNIMLKDDKTYPYILITSEKHPRIIVTRKFSKKSGKYFGPYPNATAARETARLLNRLLPFRKCNHIPSKPCLYYHIDQCLGPCINPVTPLQYEEVLGKAHMFLRGNHKSIMDWLERKMNQAAESLHFEAAREYRDLINDIKTIREKQNISYHDFRNIDIVAYAYDQEQISIQVFCFRQGNLATRESYYFPYFSEPEESFISFLVQYYSDNSALPDEICIPEIKDTTVMRIFPLTIPKRGTSRKLLCLALSNAETALSEKNHLESLKNDENHKTLASLAEILHLPQVQTIESFDISELSGTNIVGGMVQFVEGKPARSNYRKYNISPLENKNDDTAYLQHIVFRRYSRLLAEGTPLPDLILVDGGKGQIKAVLKSLKELGIHSKTEVFRLIQRMQEEVHRFAITFHRQQRIKSMTASELDGIPGIGPKRKRLLFKFFQSFEEIENASVETLIKSGLPTHIAQEVYAYFRQQTISK